MRFKRSGNLFGKNFSVKTSGFYNLRNRIYGPELIEEKYENLVDIVIDGGYGGTEASTVINCTTDDFEIIRQGKGELIY